MKRNRTVRAIAEELLDFGIVLLAQLPGVPCACLAVGDDVGVVGDAQHLFTSWVTMTEVMPRASLSLMMSFTSTAMVMGSDEGLVIHDEIRIQRDGSRQRRARRAMPPESSDGISLPPADPPACSFIMTMVDQLFRQAGVLPQRKATLSKTVAQ